MLRGTLFTIAPNWKYLTCLTRDEWLKLSYFSWGGYSLEINRNGQQLHAVIKTNFKTIK